MRPVFLFAVDNRGIVGMEHCFGAPFVAKDFSSACELVKKALENDKDKVNLDNFYLVELCSFDFGAEFPLKCAPYDSVEKICCNELFKEVNDEQE